MHKNRKCDKIPLMKPIKPNPIVQEVYHLRSEMNDRIKLHVDHSHKVFSNIFVLWGGALLLLGTVSFLSVSIENVLMYFIAATVFFISGLVIFLSFQKDHDNFTGIQRIASYLAVFYEKRGDSCWEVATYTLMVRKNRAKGKKKKQLYHVNNEFKALCFVSLVAIIVFGGIILYHVIAPQGIARGIAIGLFVGCVFYVLVLGKLLYYIADHSNIEHSIRTKKNLLKNYMEYALEIGFHTPESLREHFGEEYLGYVGITLPSPSS